MGVVVVAKKKIHEFLYSCTGGMKRRGLAETVSPGVRSATSAPGWPPSDGFSVTENNEFEMKRADFLGESFVISRILTFPTMECRFDGDLVTGIHAQIHLYYRQVSVVR